MKLIKLRLVIAAVCAVSFSAAGGIMPPDKLPVSLSLTQAVRLADGSVLPAGPYDVQIHYKGFGNAAELWFFQKGQLTGKSLAEARGVPTTAPGGAASAQTVKLQNASSEGKVFPKMEASSEGKVIPKAEGSEKSEVITKWVPPADPATFNWDKAGFREGQKGTVSPGPPGMLKLSFDSANSAAGFSAILPYVEKGRK
jgi:hypothetical protein